MDNAISSLVGEEFEGGVIATLAAPNGSLYGIPCGARQVAKFNPVNHSLTSDLTLVMMMDQASGMKVP